MAQNGGGATPRGARAGVAGYALQEGIGVDRAGAVVAGIQTATGIAVTIRILTPALAADATFMRQLRNDMAALLALRQLNVVAVLGFDPKAPAVISETVDGPSLAALLNEGGPLVPAAAFVLFDDVLAGLEALHSANVLHRDLRPESVLVDAGGVVKLRDAGVPVPPLRAGWRAGTPQFMAPELWQGAPHSPRSDLYAATAVFFEAFSGHPPYAELDVEVLRKQHTSSDIPATELPLPARGLILEGLAKDPGVRPVDATRLRADLAIAAGAFLEDDWRERGRGWLIGAARAHRSRVPPPPPVEDAAEDVDGQPAMEPALLAAGRDPFWKRPRILAALAAALLALVVIAVVAVAALSRAPATASGTPPTPTASGSPGTSPNGLFSPADVPSSSGSGAPTSTSTAPASATPIPTNSGGVTFTGASTPTPTPVCVPIILPPSPCPT